MCYIFILWLISLLVYNGYCGLNKVGLPQVQQCMLYLYPHLLQFQGVHIGNDVYICRSFVRGFMSFGLDF